MTEYQYDNASRLLSVKQPNGDTVSYTYDSHGNRLTMTYPSGKTVKYAYDEMNRLVSVKGIDGVTTTYAYDALGQRTKTVGGKETTEYTYDETGDLIAQTTTGSHDLSLKYAYDRSGRMVSESRTENGTTLDSAFTYDPLGQLTGFTRSDGISEQYSYDAVGNMTQKVKGGVTTTMTYNAANQLIKSVTGGNTTTYAYDHNGNLTEKQTATGTTRYTYNALNLLQSYMGEDGYTEHYTYNADRLLSSITTPDSTTTLTWDLLHGDGVVISETTGKTTTDYTYGLERISAQTGSKRTEYVYDGRGSVAAEVSYNNAWYTFGGRLAWKHVTSKSYTPFGEQIGEKTSGFGYNGEYYNAATGQIYLRARFYEPELNRFSQKDLLRGNVTSGTSLNRYLYCRNDPVNYADHDGQRLSTSYLTPDNGNRLRNQKPSQNQTPKTPVKPRSSGVSHPAQSNLQKTQRMVEEIHDQNPFVKSSSKKLFKDYTGIDVDETDKAPYKLWDGNRRNSSDKAESYVTRNNGRTDRIDTAKPSVKPISGTQAPCSLWESMQQGQKRRLEQQQLEGGTIKDLFLGAMNAVLKNVSDSGAGLEKGLVKVVSTLMKTPFIPGPKDEIEETKREWLQYIDRTARDRSEGLNKVIRTRADNKVAYDIGQLIGDAATTIVGFVGIGKAAKALKGIMGSISGGSMALATVNGTTGSAAAGGVAALDVAGQFVLDVLLNAQAFKSDWNTLKGDMDKASKEAKGLGEETVNESESKTEWKRMTSKESQSAAQKLGYEKTNYRAKNGEPIYYNKKTRTYISQDIGSGDGSGPHNGGVWKMSKTPEGINNKRTRLGTFDAQLNRIGD